MEGVPIIFSPHSIESMRTRGATKDEVEKVILQAKWERARQDRFEAKQNFPYHALWNNKFYKTKQVCPIFTVEDENVTVITVYVFYF